MFVCVSFIGHMIVFYLKQKTACELRISDWSSDMCSSDLDGTPLDLSVEDTFTRVATALAEAEAPDARAHWTARFKAAMSGHRFLPAGRIFAGAGTGRDVTLFNCFVMGTIPDTMACIFENLKEPALTLPQDGGTGHAFQPLPPNDPPVKGDG